MVKIEEQLNFVAVRVNDGSGCIFQPPTQDFSYVLTVKHNLVDDVKAIMRPADIRVYRGSPEHTPIRVDEVFVHESEDVAILKIEYQNAQGFDIYWADPGRQEHLNVFGYPDYLYSESEGYRPLRMECICGIEFRPNTVFELTSLNSMQTFRNGEQQNVIGLSGSGVFKIDTERLILKGIVPRLNDPGGAHNKVQGFFIALYNELLRSENQLELLPDYLTNFSFLRSDAFRLVVSGLNEPRIASTRAQLKNKALEVINSKVTPIEIKDLFKARLLLDEKDIDSIDDRVIWRTWLEFLTIMNLIRKRVFSRDELSGIFNTVRLKYSHSNEEWTSLLSTEIAYSDYRGLVKGGKVLIQTKRECREVTRIEKGEILSHIAAVLDDDQIKVDSGIDNPYAHFEFIHINHLTKACIIDRLSVYEKLIDKDEIVDALRIEYMQLFGNV